MIRNMVFAAVVVAALSACKRDEPLPPPGAVDAYTGAELPASSAAKPVGLDMFEGDLSRPGGYCSLDILNGSADKSVTVNAGAQVGAGGWAADAALKAPKSVDFVLMGATKSYSMPFTTDVAREDVAKVLQTPTLTTPGFNVIIDTQAVGPGTYQLYVHYVDDAACPLNKSLIIQ